MADTKESIHIPQHEIESIARCLLPEILKFYESKEGQQEFEQWKEQNCITKNKNRADI